jgi:hypothetical protein
MSVLDNTPTNKNFLSPLNLKFSILRSPNLNFFVQKVNIPSIRLPQIEIPNQFVTIPDPVTHMDYGSLSVTFKVDEDFGNYLEMHSWIRSLGFPDNYGEHAALSKNKEYTGFGLHSDLSLIILNAIKNPNIEITFRNAFPVYLSELQFDYTLSDVDYITATVEFDYILFDIKKI